MIDRAWTLILANILVLSFFLTTSSASDIANDSGTVQKLFAAPPREYSTAPLWVWNDDLTEEQVISTLRDLEGQQVRQVFVHPRPGLMTAYLSERWMKLWGVALREGQRLGMNVWIYDENSYPSGFAGGWVPELMPESRGRGLTFRETADVPPPSEEILGIYRLTDKGYEKVTKGAGDGQTQAGAKYLVAQIVLAGVQPWHAGRWYVDLLRPGVTQKFIELTVDAYRREFGDQFGKHLPGCFPDEPHILPAGGLPYTPDLPEQFEKRWGYSLLDHLPALYRPIGDFRRVRHNYFQVLNDLFVERWGKPYGQYCKEHGLELTGHYWEHEWPTSIRVPDNMAMYACHHRPGIDTLMNQYDDKNPHAQFGNVRAVKELASVANQMGCQRTLSEAYGAGGWDMRLEDTKRIGDWLYVLGVNTIDEHLSYITIRGARKRDHPQSFSYHEPWWEAYHVSAAYRARLTAALSQGMEINNILLLEPTTTAWMYNTETFNEPQLVEMGQSFQNLVTQLAKSQVEFDIGSEDLIARHGSVEGKGFRIGQRVYDTVVLPPRMENMNLKTMDLLETYAKSGGTLLNSGEIPSLLDGRPTDRGQQFAAKPSYKPVLLTDLPETLIKHRSKGVPLVRQADGDHGILFHYRRRLNDGEFLFLVNTSIEASTAGTLEAPSAKSVQKWDAETAAVTPYPFRPAEKDGVSLSFNLPPCGSLLLFLAQREGQSGVDEKPAGETIQPSGSMEVLRAQPNVLNIDYVDITAGGETHRGMNTIKASDFVFRKHGFERNPWNQAVQFKDELIRKTFPSDSGFEATYHFIIEQQVPASLWAVVERPDLYKITCNGKLVSPEKDQWWLDRSFGRINIVSAAQVGKNTLTLTASPFTMFHELEAVFILGPFALKSADAGFIITPDRPLKLGKWSDQDHPFYAAGVSYREQFEVSSPSNRYRVRIPSWYGSVAKVLVNDKPAGYVWHQPWECDVTEHIKNGTNTMEVTVIGTLKNTLGPHHGNPPLGMAWPGMWDNAPEQGPPPGRGYSTVGYGLFEPFVLVSVPK